MHTNFLIITILTSSSLNLSGKKIFFHFSQMLEKYQDKTAADIYGIEHLLRLFGTKTDANQPTSMPML